jgi:amidohydrolase
MIHNTLRPLASALLCLTLAHATAASAQAIDPAHFERLSAGAAAVQPKVVDWRRDIHAHPELGLQEERTAKLVAEHLKALGMEVKTGVGGHGVIGILRGGKPGRVVGLRADMDALPMAEQTGLPFASKATQLNMGKETPVMHSCGHDGHTAMLMGVAELLAGMREQIPGTVKFIFQPAEEGPSRVMQEGEKFGAAAMVADQALKAPDVDAMFGLHLIPNLPNNTLFYKAGPVLASSDRLDIKIVGKQAHGGMPWQGVDAITVAADVVSSLQNIVSRQSDISKQPLVVTVGTIQGGVRGNVVAGEVEMSGTIRGFDEDMRADAKERIQRIAESVAAAHGAIAEVKITPFYKTTVNDEPLLQAMVPVLKKAANGKAVPGSLSPASEDFSEFAFAVPSVFLLLGAPPEGKTPQTAFPNHHPQFDFDERVMETGVRAMASMALEFLSRP